MRALGVLLFVAPLVLLLAAMARIEGWAVALGIWAVALALTGVVALGAWLMTGGAA